MERDRETERKPDRDKETTLRERKMQRDRDPQGQTERQTQAERDMERQRDRHWLKELAHVGGGQRIYGVQVSIHAESRAAMQAVPFFLGGLTFRDLLLTG